MIAHTILSREGFEKIAKKTILDFCSKRQYPIPWFRISEVPHGGGAIGGFSKSAVAIYISPRIFDRLKFQSPESTAHDFFRLLYHELKHYEQFLHKSTANWNKMETEARMTSKESADTEVKIHTPEEINPNPLTKQEKDSLKEWGNTQFSIARRYRDIDPVRSEFYRGRSVAAGKIACTYNPKRSVAKSPDPITQAIGNVFEVLGIFSVPVFIGVIWWLNKKYGKEGE